MARSHPFLPAQLSIRQGSSRLSFTLYCSSMTLSIRAAGYPLQKYLHTDETSSSYVNRPVSMATFLSTAFSVCDRRPRLLLFFFADLPDIRALCASAGLAFRTFISSNSFLRNASCADICADCVLTDYR